MLLAGDASYDPRNYLGFGDNDRVPTKLVDTEWLETASDDWFADFKADGLAALMVGRLPARTPAEAALMVTKIVNYEHAPVSQEVTLVADANHGYDFETAIDALQELLPADLPPGAVEGRGQGEGDDPHPLRGPPPGLARREG